MIPLTKERIKDLPETPAVYCILNMKNFMRYIGQSKNVRQRMNEHLQNTRRYDNTPNTLYGDYNIQHGKDFFVILHFVTIRENIRDELIHREQDYIESFDSVELYNRKTTPLYVTIHVTRDTRKKLKMLCAVLEKSYDETLDFLITTTQKYGADKFLGDQK